MKNPEDKVQTKKYILNTIQYEKSESIQQINGGDVSLSLSSKNAATGQNIVAFAKCTSTVYATGSTYAIVDWGDGLWSYEGPGVHSNSASTLFEIEHKYKFSGVYKVKVAIKDMGSEALYGWSKEVTLVVSGDEYEPAVIDSLKPIQSTNMTNSTSSEMMFDNDTNTNYKSDAAEHIEDMQWAGCLFDDIYTLDTVEVKTPKGEKFFPSNISIDYTADGGKTWHSLPKYYYRYSYAKEVYNPVMDFINPDGATIEFILDGIVANGLRFSSKMFSMKNQREDKYLTLSEMRVYGKKQTLFYSSIGGNYDAAINNMFTVYGTAKTEPRVSTSILGENPNKGNFRSGTCMIGSTGWQEWNGMKLNWTDYNEAQRTHYNTLVCTVYGDDGWQDKYDGYIYVTGEFSESWKASPQHLNVQNHYSVGAIHINACRDLLLSNINVKTLGEEQNNFLQVKNLRNQTVLSRLETAINYYLKALNGQSGLITILDPRNDGTASGVSSNYWDAYNFFGYKSAYENILFYQALGSMGDIYMYMNDVAKADYYYNLQKTCKTEFNKAFWDSNKGRYIGSIDKNGLKHDFGLTFLNFQAVEAGLASEEQSKLIYDWVSGNRIVAGDTSTGEDIYGAFKYAARSNTLDVATVGPPYYFWTHNGLMMPTPGGGGAYGKNIQNGGAIFYTSYYDIMGRLKTIGADSADERLREIIKEFNIDELRRFNYNTTGAEGIIGEFPESGLIPLSFLYGYIGVGYSPQGLQIKPSLPSNMTYAGVSEFYFNNSKYNIVASKSCKTPTIKLSGDTYIVEVPTDGEYTIKYDNTIVKR